jgi:hypothetical protein
MVNGAGLTAFDAREIAQLWCEFLWAGFNYVFRRQKVTQNQIFDLAKRLHHSKSECTQFRHFTGGCDAGDYNPG